MFVFNASGLSLLLSSPPGSAADRATRPIRWLKWQWTNMEVWSLSELEDFHPLVRWVFRGKNGTVKLTGNPAWPCSPGLPWERHNTSNTQIKTDSIQTCMQVMNMSGYCINKPVMSFQQWFSPMDVIVHFLCIWTSFEINFNAAEHLSL